MTRLRPRLLVPALALIALAFLFPALSMALPHGEAAPRARERAEAALGPLHQLWSLFSVLWAESGSILEPDGQPKPNAAGSGDSGSILEPDGRH